MPAPVDADRWLHTSDGHSHPKGTRRNVTASGHDHMADLLYYVHAALRKQYVALRVDATAGQFVVEVDGQAVQRLGIKGIRQGVLPFTTCVDRLCAAARTLRVRR